MAEVDPAPELVLGSASPRRQALLAELDCRFVVRTADVDESIDDSQTAAGNAQRLARVKFDSLAELCGHEPATAGVNLLTADTLVSCASVVLSKPSDREAARQMLTFVSGRSIEVTTALCFGVRGAAREVDVRTTVELRKLLPNEISKYLATGAADDKAGGLSLQDAALPFVAAVQGCWSNVIGLPLCAVSLLMAKPVDLASFEVDRLRGCTSGFCGTAGDASYRV